VVESDHDFVTMVSDAWEITIVAISDEEAATIEIADPPTRRSHTPIKLAFQIASLPETRSAAKIAGGTVDGAEWIYKGDLVCDGQDPEGNVVQFRSALR